MSEGRGFDAATDSDELNRGTLAKQIYSCLVEVPNEWSVRVGLYGSWGSGKTTIAAWIAKWAEDSGHVPVSLKVGAENADTIWHVLREAIDDALSKLGVNVERSELQRLFDAIRKKSVNAGQIAGVVPSISDHGITFSGAILSGASNLLRFKEGDVTQIRDVLATKNKRFIITIDDLDRIDGTVLPRVLLAVRDLLDLPGFSFLLPFDDRAAINAIDMHTGVVGSGEGFLEKISDFQFRMPPLTEKQRVEFLTKLVKSSAPFFPSDQIKDLGSVLPETPRRLKSIARHLALLRAIASRSAKDEINWIIVLFALIVRQENARFAEVFFEYYVKQFNPYRDTKKSGLEEEKRRREEVFSNVLKNAEIQGGNRLRHLSEYFWDSDILRRSGRTLIKNIEILDRPPELTNYELTQIVQRLPETRLDAKAIEGALNELKIGGDIGFSYLASAFGARYARELGLSIYAFSMKESEELTQRAKETLANINRLVEADLNSIPQAEYELFRSIYSTATGYRAGRSDRHLDLSNMEDQILLRAVEKAPDADIALFDSLIETDDINTPDLAQRTKLIRLVREALGGRVSVLIRKQFLLPDFADALRTKSHLSVFQRVFFDPDGALWRADDWYALLKSAKGNLTIQRNAVDCLVFLTDLFRYGMSVAGRPTSLAKNSTAVLALSDAAIAEPFELGFQHKYRKARSELIEAGATAESIPIPEWFLLLDGEPEPSPG